MGLLPTELTLEEKQEVFTFLIAKFLFDLKALDYGVTFGEAYRTPQMALIYAKQGAGIAKSLHCLRLAIDLNLFKSGAFLTDLDSYRPAGDLWKSYSTDLVNCCWGGDFQRVDADHFSIEHNGIR